MTELDVFFKNMNPNVDSYTDKISYFYEKAKNNPALEGHLYKAIKSNGKGCVYLEDDDLIINCDTIYFIENVKEEIHSLIVKEHLSDGWDREFKYEDDELEATDLLIKEQLVNFDFIDFAVSNVSRWEVCDE